MTTKSQAPLSKQDRERLQYAAGRRDVDLNQSLFDPTGMAWRINREGAIILGGGCALLLQVAHPLVAAGVEQYSSFRRDPLKRLTSTLELMLTIVFGTAAEALAAVQVIDRRHARVRGELDEAVGPFGVGTGYDANAAELQFWVLATLVDTALKVYEMLVAPLDEDARSRYYEESKITARLFGIPESVIPRQLQDFRAYWRDMVNGDTLVVGTAGRAVAESIMTPPLPIGIREIFQMPHLFTLALLPPSLREKYGYGWGRVQDVLLAAMVTSGQYALPWLPEMLRIVPPARRAAMRVAA